MFVPDPRLTITAEKSAICELSRSPMGKFSQVQATVFLWQATHFLEVGPVLALPVLATSS